MNVNDPFVNGNDPFINNPNDPFAMNGGMGPPATGPRFPARHDSGYYRRQRQRERAEEQRREMMGVALPDTQDDEYVRFELARVGADPSSLVDPKSGYDANLYPLVGLTREEYENLLRDLNEKMSTYQEEVRKRNFYYNSALYTFILVPISMVLIIRMNVHQQNAMSALSNAIASMERRINGMHNVVLSGTKIRVGLDRAFVALGGYGSVDVKQQVIVAMDVPKGMLRARDVRESTPIPEQAREVDTLKLPDDDIVPTAQVVSPPSALAIQ